MNIYEESLKFHEEKRGKYEIKPTCSVNNAKDLSLAINEMYARHGYYFGPGANQRYLDEKPWYNPDLSIKSPNDIVENFTEIENKNLSFLATQERRLKNN